MESSITLHRVTPEELFVHDRAAHLCPKAARSFYPSKKQRAKSVLLLSSREDYNKAQVSKHGVTSGGAWEIPVAKIKENNPHLKKYKKYPTVAEFNNFRNRFSVGPLLRARASSAGEPLKAGTGSDLENLLQASVSSFSEYAASPTHSVKSRGNSGVTGSQRTDNKGHVNLLRSHVSVPQPSPRNPTQDSDFELTGVSVTGKSEDFTGNHTKSETIQTPDVERLGHPIVKQYINGYIPTSPALPSVPQTPDITTKGPDDQREVQEGTTNGVTNQYEDREDSPRKQCKKRITLKFITADGRYHNGPAGLTTVEISRQLQNNRQKSSKSKVNGSLPMAAVVFPHPVEEYYIPYQSHSHTEAMRLSMKNLAMFDKIQAMKTGPAPKSARQGTKMDGRVARWVEERQNPEDSLSIRSHRAPIVNGIPQHGKDKTLLRVEEV